MRPPAPRSRRLCAATTIGALAVLCTAPLSAQTRVPAQVLLSDLLPSDLPTSQVVLSSDTLRAYIITPAGELWLYDRAKKTRSRLAASDAWDPSLAATGTAIVYTRAGEKKIDHTVWILPLDPKTGLAAGPERRVSTGGGDVASISPDGRSVAFARDDSTGVGQSVVVMPLGGGPERVVMRSLPASVGYIRWTPDGKTLFVGVNTPVACDPNWSCLALRPELERPSASIRRVDAAGGVATIVATGPGVWPGLSPDGTTLMYADTGQTRKYVIADATGHRLQTIASPTGTIQGWFGKSSLLISVVRARTAVGRFSTVDGSRGVVVESVDRLLSPALSPDGKRVAVVQCTVTMQCRLRILDADGAARREVTFTDTYADGPYWSPDQKWLALVTRAADQTNHINAIEVATGRIVRLGDLPPSNSISSIWNPDSRAITVFPDAMGPTAEQRHIEFHRFTVDAQHQQLGGVTFAANQGGALILDGNSAIILRSVKAATEGAQQLTAVSRLAFAGGSVEHPYNLPPGNYFQAAVAPGRDWFALRSFPPDAGDATIFEVFRADGTGHRTVTMKFNAAFDQPVLLANGARLLIRENTSPGHDPEVYFVDVATSRLTRLFAVPAAEHPSHFSSSPDGRTIIHVTSQTAAPQFMALDVADAARPSHP